MANDCIDKIPDVLSVVAFLAKKFVPTQLSGTHAIEWLFPEPQGGANIFQRARECPQAQLLVIYADADSACAEALSSGLTVEEFEQEWVAECQNLFEFWRKHYQRCTVVNVHDLASYDCSSVPKNVAQLIDLLKEEVVEPSTTASSLATQITNSKRVFLEWNEVLYAASVGMSRKDDGLEHPPLYFAERLAWAADQKNETQEAASYRDVVGLNLKLQNVCEAHRQELRSMQDILDSANALVAAKDLELKNASVQLEQPTENFRFQGISTEGQKKAVKAAELTFEVEQDDANKKIEFLDGKPERLISKHADNTAVAKPATQQRAESRNKESLRPELEIAKLQIAQLQEELEMALRELDLMMDKPRSTRIQSNIDISLSLVKRTLSWGGLNATPRPLFRWLKPRHVKQREKEIAEAVVKLRSSNFFDSEWYNAQLGSTSLGSIEHYLRFGASEGRDPSENFETVGYLLANPDVVACGMNPLLHFILHGEGEGRNPKPFASGKMKAER